MLIAWPMEYWYQTGDACICYICLWPKSITNSWLELCWIGKIWFSSCNCTLICLSGRLSDGSSGCDRLHSPGYRWNMYHFQLTLWITLATIMNGKTRTQIVGNQGALCIYVLKYLNICCQFPGLRDHDYDINLARCKYIVVNLPVDKA